MNASRALVNSETMSPNWDFTSSFGASSRSTVRSGSAASTVPIVRSAAVRKSRLSWAGSLPGVGEIAVEPSVDSSVPEAQSRST